MTHIVRTAFRRTRIDAGPLPPLGFDAPPDQARHMPPLLIAAGLALAIAVICLSIASTRPARLLSPTFDAIGAALFPKDGARCCDPNGNAMVPR